MSTRKIELFSPEYFYYCGIGGILSCGITHAGITPLDVVKCNTQANPKEFTGTFQGFRYIYSGNAKPLGFPAGWAGLLKGWAPTLVGYSAQGLCKFGFYEYFKYKFSVAVGEENAIKYKDLVYMSASASAEIIADVALCPFEAIKVRVQTNPLYAKGMMDGIPKIIATEGFGNLYAGLTPLWARQVPYTIIKFMAFERTAEALYHICDTKFNRPKHLMSKGEQMGVIFTSGYIAGVLCAAVSHPADTLVSKINKLKMEGSIGEKVKFIYSGTKEQPGIGFSGLWKGLGPRIIMVGTLTGAQWFIYGAFKASVGLPTPGGQVVEKK